MELRIIKKVNYERLCSNWCSKTDIKGCAGINIFIRELNKTSDFFQFLSEVDKSYDFWLR